jgi:aspartate/glutamate racemase
MIECVANKLLNVGLSRPLILGGYVTTNKQTYSNYISDAQYLNRKENTCIEKIIEEIKLDNSLSKESGVIFNEIIKNNVSRLDSIIFACSELPIAFKIDSLFGIPIFDSVEIYAEESKNYGYSLNS